MRQHMYHLAQMNISLARMPMGQPEMEGFVSQLSHVNGLADRAPGFVWRLTTEEGNATSIHGFENPLIYLNLSLWESVEALFDFVYKSPHTIPFRDRRQWFEPMDTPGTVLWWVPQGHIPTVAEGRERLELITREGPTPAGFDFRHRFPPPLTVEATDDTAGCR